MSWPGGAVMVGRDAARPAETLSFERALEYLRAYTGAAIGAPARPPSLNGR